MPLSRWLPLALATQVASALRNHGTDEESTRGSIIWVPGITSSALWASITSDAAPLTLRACFSREGLAKQIMLAGVGANYSKATGRPSPPPSIDTGEGDGEGDEEDDSLYEDVVQDYEELGQRREQEAKKLHEMMKKAGWFRIYPAVSACVFQALGLEGFSSHGDCVRDAEGLKVEPEGDLKVDVGRYTAARLTMGLRKAFHDAGFTASQYEFFWYDWRKYGDPCWTPVTFEKLKQRVEERHRRHHAPVTLGCHSMGCPFLHHFLNGVTQEWKDTYVARLVATGPAWAGTAMVMQSLVEGPLAMPFLPNIGREMLLTMPGLYTLLPSLGMGGEHWSEDTPLVTVAAGDGGVAKSFSAASLLHTSYESDDSYYNALFEQNMLPKLEDHAVSWLKATGELQPPGVPVTCMYIVDVPTPRQYHYDFTKSAKATVTLTSDGDGTVNRESLEKPCMWFQREQDQDRYPVTLMPLTLNQGFYKKLVPTNHVSMLMDVGRTRFLGLLGTVLAADGGVSRAILDDFEAKRAEEALKASTTTTSRDFMDARSEYSASEAGTPHGNDGLQSPE